LPLSISVMHVACDTAVIIGRPVLRRCQEQQQSFTDAAITEAYSGPGETT
jgi:hypothetical protein